MSIIISREGKDAQRIQRTTIETEQYLQEYVYENPECLPLDEIDEELVLTVLAREFSTASGPIDALGVDQEGSIYIIETKLYKNPDKRLVLAQVLDYGASLWRTFEDPSAFLDKLDSAVRKQSGVSLRERLVNAYSLDEQAAGELLSSLGQNQSEGIFEYVVLMDRLHDRLKDLITYINQQSQFSVYGVELEYYVHEGLEILIPQLYGAEVRKKSAVVRGSRRTWDESSFFEEAGQLLSEGELKSLRALYEHSAARADELAWGTGAKTGSFNAKFYALDRKSLYTVNHDGTLYLNFKWLDSATSANATDALVTLLRGWGLAVPADYSDRYVRVELNEWSPRKDELIGVINESVTATGAD